MALLRKIYSEVYRKLYHIYPYNPKKYWRDELGGPEKWSHNALHSESSKETRRRAEEVVVPLLKSLDGVGIILDAGCGAGFFSYAFANSGLYDFVFGIDFQKHRIDFARKHFNHPKIGFLEGDLKLLPFPDNFFDTIWISVVLLHLPIKDKILAIEELKRVLSPNGFCLFSESILPGNGVRFQQTAAHCIWVTLDWWKTYFSPLNIQVLRDVKDYEGLLFVTNK